ncbi:MAG: hypothetical protein ACOYYU_02370 [Chloroflexota bacterium]
MRISKRLTFPLMALALAVLACSIATPAPQSDANAFNTMVAQTAQAQLLLIPPAVTAAPTQAIVPTPTTWPPVLVDATINLPRHTALDLETQTISAPLVNMERFEQNLPDFRYYEKAPTGADLVFYSENPTDLSWQFFYLVNGAHIAALLGATLSKASYEECVRTFREGLVFPHPENDAFPLDYSVFVSYPGEYFCFTTDRGNLGAFKLTAPGDYKNMPYVIMDYILWNVSLP